MIDRNILTIILSILTRYIINYSVKLPRKWKMKMKIRYVWGIITENTDRGVKWFESLIVDDIRF